MLHIRFILLATITALYTFAPVASAQKFQKSDWTTFVSWPELSVIPPQPGSEYAVRAQIATIQNGSAIYVILFNNKGRDYVLGAFNCNNSFEVLTTTTNGLYDIECDFKNVFGTIEKTRLRGTGNGGYEQGS